MSHFTTIETQIRDAAALREACQELGVELLENALARGYGSNTRKGDLVIKLAGPYDIAATRQPDGTYQLVTDWWGGHVEREVAALWGQTRNPSLMLPGLGRQSSDTIRFDLRHLFV